MHEMLFWRITTILTFPPTTSRDTSHTRGMAVAQLPHQPQALTSCKSRCKAAHGQSPSIVAFLLLLLLLLLPRHALPPRVRVLFACLPLETFAYFSPRPSAYKACNLTAGMADTEQADAPSEPQSRHVTYCGGTATFLSSCHFDPRKFCTNESHL